MIYLVRHGQTDWNVAKKTQGQTDIPLNEKGRSQAKELANKIVKLKIDRIISSDLLRAKETSEIINEKFDKEIIYDKRLREINYGTLEGIPRDTLTADVWNIVDLEPEKLNVEPKTKVYERIKNIFDELKETKDNILIVTHGGVLRMIMYYVSNSNAFDNNKYLELFNNIKINNVDIFEMDKNGIEKYKTEE